MSSRELEGIEQEYADQQLASLLEISYDDLSQLSWDIDTNESSDGLVYDYIVTFNDGSPKDILGKIKGIDNNNTARLPASSFD